MGISHFTCRVPISGQPEPGVATLLSLVEEANRFLARLATVDVSLCAGVDGAALTVEGGGEPARHLSAEALQGLLGEVRLLQRQLAVVRSADQPVVDMTVSNEWTGKE